MASHILRKSLAVVIAFGAGLMPAIAQQTTYTTRPLQYGEYRMGTTTTGSDGSVYTTRPTQYGQPQFGTTTTRPDGSTCQTRPTQYGQPQFGTTTTCN